MFEAITNLLTNSAFTIVLGALIGSFSSIFATYLSNKHQRKLAKIEITYKHRLEIILNFLLNLVNVRHSLEAFLYCDLDIEAIIHYKNLLLQHKTYLIKIKFTERDLCKKIEKDLEALYDILDYLINVINVCSQSPENIDEEYINGILKKMEQFIKLSKKIEEEIFKSEVM